MKNKKALQRGLVLLLILCMILSFVPALAHAEELGSEPSVEGQDTPNQQPDGPNTENDPVPLGEITEGQTNDPDNAGETDGTPTVSVPDDQTENSNDGTGGNPPNGTAGNENEKENVPVPTVTPTVTPTETATETPTEAPTEEPVTVYVSFDMDGHGQPIEPVAVTAGETVNCPDDPSEENYSFSGWYTDPDFSERYDFDAPVNGDLTLIALWRKTAENWYISDAEPVSETNPAEHDTPSALLQIGGSAPANLVASGTLDLLNGTVTWSAAAPDIKSVVVAEGCGAPASMRGWFASFTALESCDLRRLDTSALGDTENLFSGCGALKTLSLGEGFRFHGASGLDREAVWTRNGQSCTAAELESNSPAGGLGGTWERGTIVTATLFEAPAQKPVQLLGASAPSLPTPTLTLSAQNGTSTWPQAQTFTVSSGDAIGELSVSSDNEAIATATLEGDTVTVTPLAAGTVTVTVSSAATESVGAGTATYSAVFSPKDISQSVSVTFTSAKPENESSEPEMVVKDGDTPLVRDRDFTAEFTYDPDSSRENLKYGVAGLSFKGNYTGSFVGEFRQTLFSITYHANWSWYKDSKTGLEVDSNGNIARFTGVWVDGNTLPASAYDAVSGSTRITLKPAYLNTLSLTNHTMRIYFEDGYAETNFSVRAHLTPTTGDNSNLTLWIVLAVVSLAALAVLAVLLVKKNKRKKSSRRSRHE